MLSIYNVSVYTLPEERAEALAKFAAWLHDLGETWIIASAQFAAEWQEQIAAAGAGPVHLYVESGGDATDILVPRVAGLDVTYGASGSLGGSDCGMVVQSYSTTHVWLGDPPPDEASVSTVICFDSTDFGTRFRGRFDELVAQARRSLPDLNPVGTALGDVVPLPETPLSSPL